MASEKQFSLGDLTLAIRTGQKGKRFHHRLFRPAASGASAFDIVARILKSNEISVITSVEGSGAQL